MTNQLPIVLQLQDLATDNSTHLPDLLRKGLLVATKLSLGSFKIWLQDELNGYEDTDRLPEYRRITGRLKAHHPYYGLVPFIIQDSGLANAARQVVVFESVESLQHLVTKMSEAGTLMFPFTPMQENELMKLQDCMSPLQPTRVVGSNQLAAILERVRTQVLDWSLSLESEGIIGEGMTFSKKEKEKAKGSQNINIANFQGVLASDLKESNISQTMTMAITPRDFSSLANHLEANGVSAQDIELLERAIASDPVPTSEDNFGQKTSQWLGRMIAKAADGSWGVSVAAAGNLLGAALSRFFGWS